MIILTETTDSSSQQCDEMMLNNEVWEWLPEQEYLQPRAEDILSITNVWIKDVLINVLLNEIQLVKFLLGGLLMGHVLL
jgi:hypothetical protein